MKNKAAAAVKKMTKGFMNCGRFAKRRLEDIEALYYLERWNRVSREDRPIRVCFLVQVPEIWDKEEPVYEAMKADPGFEASMVVVPEYDFAGRKLKDHYQDSYFLSNYPEAIKALQDGKYIDFAGKYDYVFYQRPYNYYLPKEYRTHNLVKHAKLCYLPYGFSGADIFLSINSDKAFLKYMYFYFAETDGRANHVRSLYSTRPGQALHHIENTGFPVLKKYFDIPNERKYESALWTPRWSFDERIGCSHFFDYKDCIFGLPERFPGLKLSFRPHQLLFGELLSKEMMTQQEIDEMLDMLSDQEIRYDTGDDIYGVFSDTDILITDYSTIIVQFFATGKPIIYCESAIEVNEFYGRLKEGMYIAESEEDILRYMTELRNGNDYLYEKRQEIISGYLAKYQKGPEEILEKIREDYSGSESE